MKYSFFRKQNTCFHMEGAKKRQLDLISTSILVLWNKVFNISDVSEIMKICKMFTDEVLEVNYHSNWKLQHFIGASVPSFHQTKYKSRLGHPTLSYFQSFLWLMGSSVCTIKQRLIAELDRHVKWDINLDICFEQFDQMNEKQTHKCI